MLTNSAVNMVCELVFGAKSDPRIWDPRFAHMWDLPRKQGPLRCCRYTLETPFLSWILSSIHLTAACCSDCFVTNHKMKTHPMF